MPEENTQNFHEEIPPQTMHTSHKPSGGLCTPKRPTTYNLSVAWLAVSFLVLACGITPGDAQGLALNNPNSLTQCIPTSITWEGGTGPFFLAISPPNSDLALQQFANVIRSPFIWAVNLTSGTTVVFSLTDTTGQETVTVPTVIQLGPDNSCLDGISIPSGSGTTTTITTSTQATITSPATSPTSSASTTGTSNLPETSPPAITDSSSTAFDAPNSTVSNAATFTGQSGPSSATVTIISVAIGSTVFVILVSWLVWRRKTSSAATTASQSPEAAQVSVFPAQPPPPSTPEGAHPAPAVRAKSHLRMVGRTRTSQQWHEGLPQLTTELPTSAEPQTDAAVNRHSASAVLTGDTPLQHFAYGAPSAEVPQPRAAARQPRCETDGGVRLAGGPLDALDDDVLSDVSSTLPPPYNVY
ncbi:hypothetical protein VTO73DRAFT_12136 [Trametes versicolor]